MFDLVKFELKKIIARPSTRYTCLAVALVLCAIMALNVLQAKTTSNTEEILSGFDAIHQRQTAAAEHAGVLSGERIAEEVAAYYDLAFSELDPQEVASMSNAAAYDAVSSAYDDETRSELYGAGYYPWLFSAWNSGSKEPIQVSALLGPDPEVSFYDALDERVQAALDDGQGGSWTYSDAERAFWTNKQQQVAEPLSYGYAGGWENIMDCIAFAAFAMIAVCVGLAPMFAGEYRERTDSVLLASRYGRTKLIGAKLIASFVFATAVFAVCAVIICGVSLGAYGAGGGDLPCSGDGAFVAVCAYDGAVHRGHGGACIPDDAGVRGLDASVVVGTSLGAVHLCDRRCVGAVDRYDSYGRTGSSHASGCSFPDIRSGRAHHVLVLYVVSVRRPGARSGYHDRGCLRYCDGRMRAVCCLGVSSA